MTIFDNIEKWLDEMIESWKTKRNETIKNLYNNAMHNTITINGETFNVQGKNIVVKNGKVIVDDNIIKESLSGIVKVEFTGDLATLDCNVAIVNGNIMGDVDCTTLKCGDVHGDIDANTITCKNHYGDIDM